MAMLTPPADFPIPSLRLPIAPPSSRRLMILDTNIMQYAITSTGGTVIHRLNEEIERARIAEAAETGFCMTPFQILEVLGTVVPDIGVPTRPSTGQSRRQLLDQVINEARAKYAALPQLAQSSLAARAGERRSYLPEEGHALFDFCITGPCSQIDLTLQIASSLAWDYGLKSVFPKSIAQEIDNELAVLLLVTGQSQLSRFRIAKRLWDVFYAKGRKLVPQAVEGIEAANKAMQLKTRRDFLDCDLYHMACFGWFDADVTVLTCDPPDSIMNRIAVYKGMVESVAANAPDLPEDRLPAVRVGIIARCEPTGEITHIFPVQRVPTIV
ncbi:hypothetical protein [Sphingomonas sp. PP-CC-3A-396]|uniref:hypothetical protein n=1 Tax=Sphingomonas sp. PP-CC-3A-396 TaxID=2135655 RepID=UPI00104609CE|nr:hypothetical protein [Sphingomonas sp. PP-CC-3A-396]TCQ02466.1 hypothetical protein C8J40_1171 [Sphingomonas sp. PP-CC-3A-396]